MLPTFHADIWQAFKREFYPSAGLSTAEGLLWFWDEKSYSYKPNYQHLTFISKADVTHKLANAHTQRDTHSYSWLICSVTLILRSKSRFSQCQDTSFNLLPRSHHNSHRAYLLWSASITNPRSQRYSLGSGGPYVSRTIIFNETSSNPSACGSRDAWQIHPSESRLLTLIYGSASFPLPVMLCVEPLSVCFTWPNVSPVDWWLMWLIRQYGVCSIKKKRSFFSHFMMMNEWMRQARHAEGNEEWNVYPRQ